MAGYATPRTLPSDRRRNAAESAGTIPGLVARAARLARLRWASTPWVKAFWASASSPKVVCRPPKAKEPSVASVAVYDHPAGHLLEHLANPIPAGAPLTFLVSADQGNWLEVGLAQRPNGSTGWVRAATVSLHKLLYRLHVSTEINTMTLLRGATVIRTFSVATGTGGTPAPHGSFYLTELLAPQNRGYGPYAFGLSAFSTVLSSFGGGPGQIGLDGTDDAASIGKSTSHGCIRLHNKDITTLATMLPLGTPITVE